MPPLIALLGKQSHKHTITTMGVARLNFEEGSQIRVIALSVFSNVSLASALDINKLSPFNYFFAPQQADCTRGGLKAPQLVTTLRPCTEP